MSPPKDRALPRTKDPSLEDVGPDTEDVARDRAEVLRLRRERRRGEIADHLATREARALLRANISEAAKNSRRR